MKKLILALAFFAMGMTVSMAQSAPAAEAPKMEQKQRGKNKMPKNDHKGDAHKGEHKGHDKADKAMYACPMKCEAPSATAGKCGKCGMDLVAMAKTNKSEGQKEGQKQNGERKLPKRQKS
jgi:Ni/Co efflux regulator RcnB